jgi:hypothetical protein
MRYLPLITACILLTACHPDAIIKPQLVYVNKPVWYCPIPPTVAAINLNTPTLTPADQKDPGKVAQYYKADMLILMDSVAQYQAIVEQYRKSSEEAVTLQKKMEQAYQDSQQKSDAITTTP